MQLAMRFRDGAELVGTLSLRRGLEVAIEEVASGF
jgi:hypothetical protein